MASNERHAAWHNERSFAVTVLPAEGEPVDLAGGMTDFLEAIDLATDWLEREDPDRTGTTEIAIVETRDGAPNEVWRYPARDRAVHDRRLVETFGFDPVSWVPAVKEFRAARPLPAPAPPRRHERADVAPVPRPEPEHVPVPLPIRVPVQQAVPLLRAAWDDTVSRVCLIAGGISLWLALTLVDVRFLVLLAMASAGLWWRRDDRALAAARANDEDLL
jgi:hypothetical protein